MSQRGLSILEILIVLGIIGVLSAMIVPSSQENISIERVIGNGRLLSQKLLELSVDARVSGRMHRLDCNTAGVNVTTYKETRVRDYAEAILAANNSGNIISTNVQLFAMGRASSLGGLCRTSNRFFITSEGYIFSSAAPGIPDLQITAGRYDVMLVISAVGDAKIYFRERGGPLREL